jgi:hypothetical protein
MWYRVALVRSDVSEKRIASIIKGKRINELATKLAVTSKLATERLFLTSLFTRATLRNIPEDGFIEWSVTKLTIFLQE